MIKDDYKIEIAMSTTISAQVVERIIRQEVEEQTDRVIENITINYNEGKFAGFHIKFQPEKAVNYISSKEFIEQRWK